MEIKSGDLFFYKKSLLKVKKSENWLEKKKWRYDDGEDKSAKRCKCWTLHSWVGRIILIRITLL